MLALPVEFVGADGLKFGEKGVDDAEVDVVAHVDPHAHEQCVKRDRDGRVEVVENLGRLSLKINQSAHGR